MSSHFNSLPHLCLLTFRLSFLPSGIISVEYHDYLLDFWVFTTLVALATGPPACPIEIIAARELDLIQRLEGPGALLDQECGLLDFQKSLSRQHCWLLGRLSRY
jgi:hypothetical protein